MTIRQNSVVDIKPVLIQAVRLLNKKEDLKLSACVFSTVSDVKETDAVKNP